MQLLLVTLLVTL